MKRRVMITSELHQSYFNTLRDIFCGVIFCLIFPFEGFCVFVIKFDVVEFFCFPLDDLGGQQSVCPVRVRLTSRNEYLT